MLEEKGAERRREKMKHVSFQREGEEKRHTARREVKDKTSMHGRRREGNKACVLPRERQRQHRRCRGKRERQKGTHARGARFKSREQCFIIVVKEKKRHMPLREPGAHRIR
jgi:hypothetical protein